MEVRRIVAACQLLKRQQKLVCFDCRRGVLTAELRLAGRAVFLLLPWRCSRGTVCAFLVNFSHVVAIPILFCSSCHHVMAIFWPFCVIWPWKRPTSGWGSFWESSSFVPWLVLNAFRQGSGVVPEWPCNSGFIRKSSRRANAASMRFFVLLTSFDNLFVTLPKFPQKLQLCSLPAIWEHSSFVPSCY